MPEPADIADQIFRESSWNARVLAVRRIPELFGSGLHAEEFSKVAERVYVPLLTPDFAYVHWREEYELESVRRSYVIARDATRGFTRVRESELAAVIREHPESVRAFRLLLGFTAPEFVEACALVSEQHGLPVVGKSALESAEVRARSLFDSAITCARVVHLCMSGTLFPPPIEGSAVRLKLNKPDTVEGWESVRMYAREGVPFEVLLHQRAYGGAFRQLLDATSTMRGDLLEDPVEQLFTRSRIPFIRTGPSNQRLVQERFGLAVNPAPDFVVFDPRTSALRALLECKLANDGGTARDKAARYRALRAEAVRLGGVPVFAVLAGIGWRRTADALGPVVQATDGRVFTLANIEEMLTVEPFPALCGQAIS